MRLSKVDPSSYSTPENEIITNIDLAWNIDFERHVVSGTATYTFKILAASIETIVSFIFRLIKLSCITLDPFSTLVFGCLRHNY